MADTRTCDQCGKGGYESGLGQLLDFRGPSGTIWRHRACQDRRALEGALKRAELESLAYGSLPAF